MLNRLIDAMKVDVTGIGVMKAERRMALVMAAHKCSRREAYVRLIDGTTDVYGNRVSFDDVPIEAFAYMRGVPDEP